MSNWIDRNANGRDDLYRTAEVLNAKMVLGEKSQTDPGVDRHEPVPSAQGKIRDQSGHQACLSRSLECPGAGNKSRLNFPIGFTQRPLPGKPPECRDVIQIEQVFLLPSQKGSFATEAEARAKEMRGDSSASPEVQTSVMNARLRSTLKARTVEMLMRGPLVSARVSSTSHSAETLAGQGLFSFFSLGDLRYGLQNGQIEEITGGVSLTHGCVRTNPQRHL